jgi:aerotaxis receptor
MRLNKPVTNVEYILNDRDTIVSATDLKGRITYANPYFIEVSGYSHDELIGKPHNILRHPDMPAAGFGDLWVTVKQGLPWTGMVKNRCKNGDFYWVMANVTPVIENGKPVGYMSVRTKPTRDQVAAADALYKKIAAGHRVVLRQGMVCRTGLFGLIERLVRMPFAVRVGLVLSLQLIAAAVLGYAAWSSEALANAGLNVWFAALAGASMIVTGSFWSFLMRGVAAPLKQALRATQAMAGGDMTVNIETDRIDEVGQLLRSLRQMNINVRSIVGDVRNNFEKMQVSTREIATGNRDLSGRTDSQAAALEETASSMEQLASTVQQNAERSTRGNEVAKAAMQVAEKGGAAMEQVLVTIGEISESSSKIADIMSIIEGIASQTNLLALNAAVEAARAGEAGRGFAVVASEVRQLAQRSASAAMDIKKLIDASVDRVNVGTAQARDAGETVRSLIESVNRVTGIMGEISTASHEQSDGIEQVNQAVTQMDGVTQQNASLVEQAAQATSDLNQRAQTLMEALAVFKLRRAA